MWIFPTGKGRRKEEETVVGTAFPSPTDRFPRVFGRYRLVAFLGGGGMGGVYLAEDQKLGIQVALKVPHPALLSNAEALERFYREARAAARLDHPGLCWVLDVGQIDGIPFFVMRYIPGITLSKCATALSPRGAAKLVRSVALAMAAAHRMGVVHRDLKPSNILVTPEGEPVVTDFGVALLLGPEARRLTNPGDAMGTLPYMSPEQLLGKVEEIGPASDVYSLGVVLYELLCGRHPYKNPIVELTHPTRPPTAERPSTIRAEVERELDQICLTAFAPAARDRYPTMDRLAEALEAFLEMPANTGARPGVATESGDGPVLVRREAIRFAFVGHGEQVGPNGPSPDSLYVDVGNAFRAGVIDHHHLESPYGGCTARLVLTHPELVEGAIAGGRRQDDPFTIVMHKQPDLDCVASAFLAIARLTTGAFPDGAEALVRYVDKVDEGALGASLANPASLYTAYQILVSRFERDRGLNEVAGYQATVEAGLALVEYVVEHRTQRGVSLPAVDALACPGMFDAEDRRAVDADIARYERKLGAPETCARQGRLKLPGEFGGTVTVEALMVRNVQRVDDPDGCLFFKDWARSDANRAGNGQGFLALSVFESEGSQQPRRCILSVTPDSGVSLRGLGERLETAESERRRGIHGRDDRGVDAVTGAVLPPRVGYANADPWYDGRAHGYTIVDAPRGGTELTADEIEAIFLRFGGVG